MQTLPCRVGVLNQPFVLLVAFAKLLIELWLVITGTHFALYVLQDIMPDLEELSVAITILTVGLTDSVS
jgi:hypothetical protein